MQLGDDILCSGTSDITSPIHSALPSARRLSTFKHRKSELKLQNKYNLNGKSLSDDAVKNQNEANCVKLDYVGSLVDCRLISFSSNIFFFRNKIRKQTIQ